MAYRMAVINDTHHCLQDQRAVDLALDVFEDIQPEVLFLNGDILDAFNLNFYSPKHPEIQFKLEDEFNSARLFLEDCRKRLPNAKIIYNAGNHEHRVDRFIIAYAKPFWGLLSVEKQLRLDDLEIEYYPYNNAYNVKGTSLYLQHSPPSYGENGARTSLLKKPGASFIYGCTHRMQAAHVTHANGEVHSVYFNGWLGSIDATPEHAQVFSYIKNHLTWQQCFAIVTVDEPHFFVNQYQIKDYKVSVDGHLYIG